MLFATILLASMASSHAMLLPNKGDKSSLPKRADSDIVKREVVPLHYIVVLKLGESESAYQAHHKQLVEQISALKERRELPDGVSDKLQLFNVLHFVGYTGYLPPTMLESVKRDPIVDYVEEDQIAYVNAFAQQKGAPWGIARISQRANKKTPEYDYDDQAGTGVTAYVLDTGIKVEHPDFEGRAKWGIAIAPPYLQEDALGHGTHVAGILGSKTYGVAKKVKLVAVAVYNATGKGPVSQIIKGIEYAVKDHQATVKSKTKGYRGATINMSIGTTAFTALDQAANAAIKAGMHVVVAAGNANQDACVFSPGRATGPIKVGATDIDDVRYPLSNFGTCVDVQAPGTNILSTGIHLVTAVMSGTSMACPHVAGIISTFMSLQPDVESEYSKKPAKPVRPADLKRMFLRFSTRAVVKGLDKDTPNKFAFSGAGLSLHDLWIL